MKGVKVSEVDIAFLGHRLEGARTARFFVSFLIDTAPAVSRREFNQAPLGLGASTHMVVTPRTKDGENSEDSPAGRSAAHTTTTVKSYWVQPLASDSRNWLSEITEWASRQHFNEGRVVHYAVYVGSAADDRDTRVESTIDAPDLLLLHQSAC